MKLTRAQFLKVLPAAALVLAGCTAAPTAPADTDELVFDHAYGRRMWKKDFRLTAGCMLCAGHSNSRMIRLTLFPVQAGQLYIRECFW